MIRGCKVRSRSARIGLRLSGCDLCDHASLMMLSACSYDFERLQTVTIFSNGQIGPTGRNHEVVLDPLRQHARAPWRPAVAYGRFLLCSCVPRREGILGRRAGLEERSLSTATGSQL